MRTRFIQNDILALLQDNKRHTMQELSNELGISRSTCIRHLNDLSMHFNIKTIVGGKHSGVRLVDKKLDVTDLSDFELQLIIAKIESLQDSNPNIKKFVGKLREYVKENEDEDDYIL